MSGDVQSLLARAEAARDADAMVRAAGVALERGAPESSLAPLERMLAEYPQDARLWRLLGLAHLKLQDTPNALGPMAKAAELAPGEAVIVADHGLACYEAGLPSVALFERARDLAPGDRGILLRLAAALLAEGRGEQAIALLDRATQEAPAWIEGHTALARMRWVRGDEQGFTDSFDRALESLPRNLDLWQAYLRQLLHAELLDRALAGVARGRSAAGQQRLFDAVEVYVRCERGDANAAIALLQRLQPLREPELIIHYLRLLLRVGQVQDAAEIAAQEAPRDPLGRFWPYLATCWRLLGDRRWQWLEGDPRFIGVYDLRDQLPPLDALAERLRTLHATVAAPLGQSLRGGTQTEGNLFSRIEPEIRALRAAMLRAVEHHVAQLPPAQPNHPLLIPKRAPIVFAGSWSVRLTGGGRHVDHVHPSGWLSSAMYIAVPNQQERGPGQAGWLTFGEVGDLGLNLPPFRTVEPVPGRLVLFPSTLWHGTKPFGEGERLTIAFDVRRP